MHPVVGVLIGYVAGSVPFAYLAGKLFRGIDLRTHGSGNLGATNVFRVMGPRLGALVMVLDMAKGALPVLYLPPLAGVPRAGWWAIGYGVAAIVGHVRPVFLLGKGGGKGVATAAGVFLALVPWATLVGVAVWMAVVLTTGYVSVGSLAAAVVLPVAVLVAQGIRSPVLLVSAAVALFVFWTHRANIGRLRRGEEHRFGRKTPA